METFAFWKGQLFGIVQTTQFAVEAILQPMTWKQYGSSHDRPRQRTAAGFIDAGHVRNPFGPKIAFEAQTFPVFSTHRSSNNLFAARGNLKRKKRGRIFCRKKLLDPS